MERTLLIGSGERISVKTTSGDGLRIHYDVSGNGRGLLLLHGFGNDRTMWARSGWIEKLDNDFRVIAMDFRGCGESDAPELPSAYSIDSHVADVEAVVAACGGTNPIVWGWSLGATVALHLASRGKALATVAAGTYFGRIFTPDRVRAGIAEASRDVDRARLRGMETWPEVQPVDIRGPFLMYSGTGDGNVVRQLEIQRSAIEGAGGELRVLDGCHHLDLVTSTEKVASMLKPFLFAQP